jgi:uncharacterized protein (DUF3820 family)
MIFKDAAAFRLPFGKYRGQTLDQIPLDYLDWLNGRELYPDTRRALDTYLADPAIQKALKEEMEKEND